MPQMSLTSVLKALPEPLCAEYEMKEILGTGAYALVYRIQHCRSGEQFALKVVEKAPLAARALMPQLQREVEHLQAHRNTPHIVQLCDVADTTNAVFLRFQLCEKSLEQLIDEDGALEEEEALQFFRQALLGVRELHANGTIHRDLKLSNMLVDSEGVLRICDFGWACREGEELTGLSGTPQYAPPEMLDAAGPPHTTKVDVYSLGACLQHLLLGRIAEGPEDLPLEASAELLELLAELLQKDPEARPTIDEVLERSILRPSPFAQLWQHGQDFLAQFGWPQGSAAARTVPNRTRALKMTVPSATPSPAPSSHCERAAHWSQMTKTSRTPQMSAAPSLPHQLPTPCRVGVQPHKNGKLFNQGFCVNLRAGPAASYGGNINGHMLRR